MLNHGCSVQGLNLIYFFAPAIIKAYKSGASASLIKCFAKRSFPIQQTKILIQIPFSTRSVFCVMKTAQIFIQDFAKRFCSMFISSNQLPGLREAFMSLLYNQKHFQTHNSKDSYNCGLTFRSYTQAGLFILISFNAIF